MTKRTVLITGASAGIGEAFAEVFAAEGFDLVVVARRVDRLRALADRLAQQHGVSTHVIVSDLGSRESVSQICADLDTHGLVIDALVNNAGYGVPGVFAASRWARHEAMLQVMLLGGVELIYRLLPGMVQRRYGRIINVASLAGLLPSTAGHTLYAATKSFLIKFSESLAEETRRDGVHVTALCPGFTYSEFHDVTGTREKVSQLPHWMWMDAATVARQGFGAVMAGTPVYVNGRVNRTFAALVRLMPLRLVNAVVHRTGGRYRNVTE